MDELIVIKIVADAEITYTLDDVPQELAETVITYQDACNLSGVVYAFSKILHELWDYAHKHGKGTDWMNSHPLVLLTIDKLTQLSRYELNNKGQNGFNIYDFVKKAAERETRKENRNV